MQNNGIASGDRIKILNHPEGIPQFCILNSEFCITGTKRKELYDYEKAFLVG